MQQTNSSEEDEQELLVRMGKVKQIYWRAFQIVKSWIDIWRGVDNTAPVYDKYNFRVVIVNYKSCQKNKRRKNSQAAVLLSLLIRLVCIDHPEVQ